MTIGSTSFPPSPLERLLLEAVVRVVVVVGAVVREEVLRDLGRVRDQVDLVPEQGWEIDPDPLAVQ